MIRIVTASAVLLTLGVYPMSADDWPEFRGKGRMGIWTESDILETFPSGGLTVRWRTPIHHGFSGPAVADGRIFVTDFERARGLDGIERILCLDEETGDILWTQSWEASYLGISWDEGPRATPTVDRDQVYAVGASGVMTALRVDTGEVLWRTRFVEDWGAEVPQWGSAVRRSSTAIVSSRSSAEHRTQRSSPSTGPPARRSGERCPRSSLARAWERRSSPRPAGSGNS